MKASYGMDVAFVGARGHIADIVSLVSRPGVDKPHDLIGKHISVPDTSAALGMKRMCNLLLLKCKVRTRLSERSTAQCESVVAMGTSPPAPRANAQLQNIDVITMKNCLRVPRANAKLQTLTCEAGRA